MLLWSSVMTPCLTRHDSNQRSACAPSVRVCPHVCCQVYKSTKYQFSVSNTATEATRSMSIPTSIHKHPCSVSCHAPRCSTPSQHILHQMSLNELPQNTLSINTPLGDDVCKDSISMECPPPVDACSQRATKRHNAHQRHTRSLHSSSCAESCFFSKAQSVSVHGLQPKHVVLQKCSAHPLSSRCCSILSATRCSSAFQFDVLPEPRSTSAFEVCCSRPLSAKRSSPSSRRSLPPGSAKIDIPLQIASRRSCHAQRAATFASHSPRVFGLHWPSRKRPRVLQVYRSLRSFLRCLPDGSGDSMWCPPLPSRRAPLTCPAAPVRKLSDRIVPPLHPGHKFRHSFLICRG